MKLSEIGSFVVRWVGATVLALTCMVGGYALGGLTIALIDQVMGGTMSTATSLESFLLIAWPVSSLYLSVLLRFVLPHKFEISASRASTIVLGAIVAFVVMAFTSFGLGVSFGQSPGFVWLVAFWPGCAALLWQVMKPHTLSDGGK